MCEFSTGVVCDLTVKGMERVNADGGVSAVGKLERGGKSASVESERLRGEPLWELVLEFAVPCAPLCEVWINSDLGTLADDDFGRAGRRGGGANEAEGVAVGADAWTGKTESKFGAVRRDRRRD